MKLVANVFLKENFQKEIMIPSTSNLTLKSFSNINSYLYLSDSEFRWRKSMLKESQKGTKPVTSNDVFT